MFFLEKLEIIDYCCLKIEDYIRWSGSGNISTLGEERRTQYKEYKEYILKMTNIAESLIKGKLLEGGETFWFLMAENTDKRDEKQNTIIFQSAQLSGKLA